MCHSEATHDNLLSLVARVVLARLSDFKKYRVIRMHVTLPTNSAIDSTSCFTYNTAAG
eukprot:m.284553 g.284553  ORF g.284553 m.284553 type:complete len:58 (+) comp15765_c0_seq1:2733-2906(+)